MGIPRSGKRELSRYGRNCPANIVGPDWRVQFEKAFYSVPHRLIGTRVLEWPLVFANPLMASACMDRLVHRATKLVIEGKSYRMDSFVRTSRDLSPPESP